MQQQGCCRKALNLSHIFDCELKRKLIHHLERLTSLLATLPAAGADSCCSGDARASELVEAARGQDGVVESSPASDLVRNSAASGGVETLHRAKDFDLRTPCLEGTEFTTQFRELFETGRARITDVAARVSRAIRRMSGMSPQDEAAIMGYYKEDLEHNRRYLDTL